MSYQLERPDGKLSLKILTPVHYRDRLLAGRLTPPVGIISGDVRSLSQLHSFLAPDIQSLAGINLRELKEWIETVIGDNKLAESVGIIINESVSYAETCVNIYELVGYRLDQARKNVEA